MDEYLLELDKFIEESKKRFEDTLKQIVDIPTISADLSHKNDIMHAVQSVSDLIAGFGGVAEIVRTKGNPVVIGRFESSHCSKSVLIYNHLDVQPADESRWTHKPFHLEKDGDKYFGRGTTDDKGPALTALFSALYAYRHNLPVNINLVWEFEEEIGSPSFEGFLKTKKDTLRSDVAVISDTLWLDRDIPSITYGLRGLQAATLYLETGKKDVHSGVTGGAARNPVGEIVHLVSRLYDAGTGRVNIPHFYDKILPVQKTELDGFIRSGFSVKKFMHVNGFKSLRTNDVREILKRLWVMPTFEVHGIVGGYTGSGVKTIIPPNAEAKITMRLVPAQKPGTILKLLKNYVKSLNPDVVVKPEGSLDPFSTDITGHYTRAVFDALKFATGKKPVFIREGGSIGTVVTIKKYLRCPITFIGLSIPENGYHAPDENFEYRQFATGVKTFVKFFYNIGTNKKLPKIVQQLS